MKNETRDTISLVAATALVTGTMIFGMLTVSIVWLRVLFAVLSVFFFLLGVQFSLESSTSKEQWK